jgi:hypothetical protein
MAADHLAAAKLYAEPIWGCFSGSIAASPETGSQGQLELRIPNRDCS